MNELHEKYDWRVTISYSIVEKLNIRCKHLPLKRGRLTVQKEMLNKSVSARRGESHAASETCPVQKL